MKVKLNRRMPFSYKDNWTWYDIGDEFDVVETKELYFDDTCNQGYKVSKGGFVFEGHCRKDSFDEVLS